MAVMKPLGFHPSSLVCIQLMSPTCRLMGNETSSGTLEPDYSVGWLERAYYPISGLLARWRMISAWYASVVNSDTSVSTG